MVLEALRKKQKILSSSQSMFLPLEYIRLVLLLLCSQMGQLPLAVRLNPLKYCVIETINSVQCTAKFTICWVNVRVSNVEIK